MCVFDSRQDRMGNEAASVAILRHGETPIKADYDVDKVTQQIALIYTRQETSVFPLFFFNGAIEKPFYFSFPSSRASCRLVALLKNYTLKDATDVIDLLELVVVINELKTRRANY